MHGVICKRVLLTCLFLLVVIHVSCKKCRDSKHHIIIVGGQCSLLRAVEGRAQWREEGSLCHDTVLFFVRVVPFVVFVC